MATPTPAPTQVRRPWRTTIRSAVQVAIPTIITLGLVVPEIVQIILEESGDTMPAGIRAVLLAATAVVVAVAAILTRVMAIPQVEAWLDRHLKPLAADPTPATRTRTAYVGRRRAEGGRVDGHLVAAIVIGGLLVWLIIQVLELLILRA